MISSEEFQQKLQSGQINEALALLSRDPTLLHRGFTHELDVTTQMTPDSPDREYLRTKINLLTGEIHNEIGQHFATDRANYLQLQQLHINQIVASHRIVRGHLDRVKAILTALLPAQTSAPSGSIATAAAEAEDWNHADLSNRLSRSIARSISQHSHPVAASSEIDGFESIAVAGSATTAAPQRGGEFDEIDLSVQEEDEIWEEWVEDDDFPPDAVLPQPTALPAEIELPSLQEHWVRRPLNPIDVKPIMPRSKPASVDPAERWDKFVPEYIEIDPKQARSIDRTADLDPDAPKRDL